MILRTIVSLDTRICESAFALNVKKLQVQVQEDSRILAELESEAQRGPEG